MGVSGSMLKCLYLGIIPACLSQIYLSYCLTSVLTDSTFGQLTQYSSCQSVLTPEYLL